MGAPTDLDDACAEWLAVIEAALATTPGGAIDRAFVSPPPAFDCCPQLTVHVGGPRLADTAPLSPPLEPASRTRGVVGSVNLVELTATIVRCVPMIDDEGSLPSVGDISAAARVMNADVWAVWNWTRRRHADGTLFSSPSGTRELILEPAFQLVPQGGCGGWQVGISVQVPGYEA